MALYYNIGTGNTAVTYQKYGQLLSDALTSIEQSSPGISPQAVASTHERVGCEPRNGNWPHTEAWLIIHLDGGLYTSTFDKRLNEIWMFNPQEYGDDAKDMSSKMPTELMQKYASKLHGRSLEQDLKLAGLFHDGMGKKGIVSNMSKDGDNKYVNFVAPDGSFNEKYQIQEVGVKNDNSGLSYTGQGDDWYQFTYQFMLHFQ